MTRQLAEPKRLKFTQPLCERLQPPPPGKRERLVWDINLPGFGVRISPKGRKSWIVQTRVVGRVPPEVQHTLGTMLIIPLLSEARNRAREFMATAHSGVHPVKQRKAELAAEQKAAADAAFTLEPLLEQFIKQQHHSSRPATVYEVNRLCRRAIPFIGTLPVKQIVKADILKMMNDLASSRKNAWRGNTGPALAEASGILRHLRALFKWALDHDMIERDPTQGIRSPLGKGKSERERVLTTDEIIALWQVADEIGYPFGPIIQLLLLTGQREKEIGDMTWSELGDLERRTLSLPSTRTKNHRPHVVHLSDLAIEIIGKLPRFADAGASYLFSVDGKKPVAAYSDTKARIDARLAEILPGMEHWTYHDLRRTMATGMADLGIAPQVLDRCLNHVSGTISGVARIYNRGQYLEERKAALDAWSRRVEQLVYPERTRNTVVQLNLFARH